MIRLRMKARDPRAKAWDIMRWGLDRKRRWPDDELEFNSLVKSYFHLSFLSNADLGVARSFSWELVSLVMLCMRFCCYLTLISQIVLLIWFQRRSRYFWAESPVMIQTLGGSATTHVHLSPRLKVHALLNPSPGTPNETSPANTPNIPRANFFNGTLLLCPHNRFRSELTFLKIVPIAGIENVWFVSRPGKSFSKGAYRTRVAGSAGGATSVGSSAGLDGKAW